MSQSVKPLTLQGLSAANAEWGDPGHGRTAEEEGRHQPPSPPVLREVSDLMASFRATAAAAVSGAAPFPSAAATQNQGKM